MSSDTGSPGHPARIGAEGQRRRATRLADVIDAFCAADGLTRPSTQGMHPSLPSAESVTRLVHTFRAVLFPGYFGATRSLSEEALRFHVGATLDRLATQLSEQVRRGFCFTCREREPGACVECDRKARRVADQLIADLPGIRLLLASDVQAAYTGDPAATSPEETVLCYPGVFAVMCQRVAHRLSQLGVPLLPRMITEHAHGGTGIDIHPGAEIGEAFFIDHGTGVVIGETCRIGRRVRLYQGVTLGARSFPLDAEGKPVKGLPRHPIVEDDVIIYSGATVLGRVTIGAGSVIGGNVWLTRSVPPGSRVGQAKGEGLVE
ncbi:MAG: Serine acetyltransferase [Acidobacteria bacterium]|nr:Serine acetyltransferase [Acidobacteriota bacterium]